MTDCRTDWNVGGVEEWAPFVPHLIKQANPPFIPTCRFDNLSNHTRAESFIQSGGFSHRKKTFCCSQPRDSGQSSKLKFHNRRTAMERISAMARFYFESARKQQFQWVQYLSNAASTSDREWLASCKVIVCISGMAKPAFGVKLQRIFEVTCWCKGCKMRDSYCYLH